MNNLNLIYNFHLNQKKDYIYNRINISENKNFLYNIFFLLNKIYTRFFSFPCDFFHYSFKLYLNNNILILKIFY